MSAVRKSVMCSPPAAELIKENQYTMAEIAYMVGFSDPHYFSKSFKSYWGMTSTEYAKNQIGR